MNTTAKPRLTEHQARTLAAPVAEDVEHYDTLRDSVPTDLDHIDPRA